MPGFMEMVFLDQTFNFSLFFIFISYAVGSDGKCTVRGFRVYIKLDYSAA